MSLEAGLRKLRENPAACHFDRVRILGRLRAVEDGGLTSLERALVDVADECAYWFARNGIMPPPALARLERLLGEEN